MNTPLSWIKAYVPELQCTEQEYMDAMTMSGTKVEGYEKFKSGEYDLVILDVMMPDVDGFTVAKRIRQNEET